MNWIKDVGRAADMVIHPTATVVACCCNRQCSLFKQALIKRISPESAPVPIDYHNSILFQCLSLGFEHATSTLSGNLTANYIAT